MVTKNLFESRKKEKAYLVGVLTHSQRKWDAIESLEELQSLAKTAGAVEVGSTLAEVRNISPATFLGKGKVDQLKGEIKGCDANLVIFDGDLSPSQGRNLEEVWGVRVVDRTGIILDIFSIHAKSKEGKLQVELAQYQYFYPRLVGAWSHLSKQWGGGIGLRGPGETQLEVDRRRVREKIARIKKSLERVTSSREIHREKRESVPIPTITLVGYTNAGKSTLFNALTDSEQLVEDKLFATLDPKTKRLKLPSGRQILLTDTVGFIRKLPHQLVEAFKSTFEEAGQSDLLIHVVDAAYPDFRHRVEVVNKVLKELELDSIPKIEAMNKMDVAGFHFNGNVRDVIPVSAKEKTGLEDLMKEIDRKLTETLSPMKLFLPHPYGNLLSSLYAHGRVFNFRDKSNGIEVEVALPEKWKRKFIQYSH